MRTVPQAAIDLLTQPREVGARATFRKTLPVFTYHSTTNAIGLTDPAWIDVCNYGTGLLRVTSVGNVLYTQEIPDINAAWPAWVNTGIALYPGSRPAVDEGFVWYQIPMGTISYRHFGTWSELNEVTDILGATALAPLADRCYALWQRNAGSYEIVSVNNQESSQYTLYGLTSLPRIDVVSYGGKQYFYTMDRDAGRIIEIQHAGNAVSGQDSYGVGKAIIPIDAIDDVYGLKLGYASIVDNKVVVTGRLTRTSDDAAVTFDVYAIGPEHFSLGREMFIQSNNLNGKMLRVGDELIVSGATQYYTAKATTLFGGDSHPDLEVTTSDFANFTLSEAENRSSNVDMDVSTELAHTAVAVGSDVEIEMAHDNNWCKLATCSVDVDRTITDEQGQTRIVSGVGKSAKRLGQWSPDQGVYIPSQATMYDNPANMTKVIRASGLWESSDPENPDAPVQLKDLNKLGVLYSVARASRGGAMRGKFYFPSDANFKPYYGVAINYYRESAAEAAARLGVEVNDLEDDMFGHNGLVAIYSQTEHSGSPGISLNLWKDSVLTKLTSVSFTISANTWHWLQIDFIEGEIRVKYRLDGNNQPWTEKIAYMYASTTLPWKRETLGRGAIVMKNIMPTISVYGLASDDMTIAVDNNTAIPSSGTLLIGSEQITYNGRSTYNQSSPSGIPVGQSDAWAMELLKTVQQASGFTGERVALRGIHATMQAANADHSFQGAALAVVDAGINSNYGAHRTFRIADWDAVVPSIWAPNPQVAGWTNNVGNVTYGSWVSGVGMGVSGVYVSTDPTPFLSDGGEMYTGPFSIMKIKPALYVTARGANGTTATSHIAGLATLYTSQRVLCAVAASFSQDEDQSIEDALKTIVRLSGGEVTCKGIDEDHAFTANSAWNVWDHKNFIATFDLPVINDGSSVGMSFRAQGSTVWAFGHPWSAGAGYSLEFERVGSAYRMSLYDLADYTLFERVPVRPTNLNGASYANVPAGTIKLSVHDNFFSVWLNGRYLHTFYHAQYQTGTSISFFSRQASTFRVHLSELDHLLADIVVGTRGNGMTVLSELLGDRHILWRDEPDGSMFFYKNRRYIGELPDIISSVSDMKTDAVITRIRAEGVNVSEILDAELIREYGNTFVTVNARHANNTEEARKEAQFLIDENWRNALSKKWALAPHPAIQPGDSVYAPAIDEDNTYIIRSQSISIGFSGDNFICDMQVDVTRAERE